MHLPVSRAKDRFCALLIVLAAALVWGQSLRFDFVWDDNYFIVRNPSLRSLAHAPEMFYSLQAQADMPEKFVVFRPLRNLQYALLYALGGKASPQPWLFHLANLCWQALAGILLFSVLRQLLRRFSGNASDPSGLALLGALAFTVHPVVAEVVCWAKSLDDIMAAAFTLAACRALLKWNPAAPQDRRHWQALGWFLLAVYAKESAVPFALLVFFIFRKIHGLAWKRSLGLTAGFFIAALVYVVNRHLVLGRSSQIDPISGSYVQTLLDMLPVTTEYVRLLLGIPPFCADYSYQVGHPGWSGYEKIAGAALLGLFVGLGIKAWRSERFQLAGFGLLWTGLFLLPVANLLPMMQYMAERFLYLPLIGWIMAALALLAVCRRRTVLLLAGAVLIFWAGLAWQRAAVWRDEWTLFSRTQLECPPMARVENNAVAALLQLPQFRPVFDFDPVSQQLGVRDGSSPEQQARALATLLEVRKQFPEDEKLSKALAFLCVKLGRPDGAVLFFSRAAEKSPGTLDNWNNLAIAATTAKEWAIAAKAVQNALTLAPNDPNTLQIALGYHWQAEDYVGALEILKRIKQAAPQNPDTDRWMQQAEEKIRGQAPQ